MPANLTPQYRKAEDAYRRAQSPEEQVQCLQEMLRLIPKHKGTDHLQADLKTRLKEARAAVTTEAKTSTGKRSYRFPRQGAGQVIVAGIPNSGKSRLLCELTNATPETADYPFTTHEPTPGMMVWEDVKVQLIDTPPLSATHLEPYVLNMLRSADLVLLCLDGRNDDAPDETVALLEQLSQRKTELSSQSGFAEEDMSIVHVPTRLVVTHAHADGVADRLEYLQELLNPMPFPTVQVNLDQPDDVERLRQEVYAALNVIRVYTKAPGKPADYQDPYTIPVGGTVEDLAAKVHRELAESLKFAKVWGTSAHDGQSVGRDHVLDDRDLVELHD